MQSPSALFPELKNQILPDGQRGTVKWSEMRTVAAVVTVKILLERELVMEIVCQGNCN